MKQQQGVALITALLVVVLAASAATAMALRGQADMRRTSAVFERDMSRHIALGAEKMVLQLLEQVDGPDELIWDTCRSPSLPFDVDSVRLQATLDDMQCRYNLNALAGADDVEQGYFARLVDRVGQETGVDMPSGAALAVAVTDWMNAESDDPRYRLEQPPRVSGNRSFLLAPRHAHAPAASVRAHQRGCRHLAPVRCHRGPYATSTPSAQSRHPYQLPGLAGYPAVALSA